jgi:hypothetical protein
VLGPVKKFAQHYRAKRDVRGGMLLQMLCYARAILTEMANPGVGIEEILHHHGSLPDFVIPVAGNPPARHPRSFAENRGILAEKATVAIR